MAIRVRRGSDADRLTVILEEGEVAFTTDTQMFYVGDNATLGGILIGPGAVVPTAWGTITGILANQLDLQGALNAKEPTITAGVITDYYRGDKTFQPFPSIPSVTPAALTRVDDTNVTLTLGGTPTLALLQATSLTLGWTGTLADVRIASSGTWNAKQDAITLTTIGTSGAATFIANTLNIPNYLDTDTGITTLNTLVALTQTFAVGTSGTDFAINSAISTHTFDLPTASAINRGALSSTDWTTFNSKQGAITLTTTGTTGASTFIANTLNIPSYADQFVGTVTSVGLTAPSAFTITGSPITTSGTLAITGAGLGSQYIDGTGALQTFPALSSGTVTSVAASVPTFLSVSGSPITTSGTLAVTLSGTALPVANGGTGVTSSTGSGNNVLSTSPTLVAPILGSASATALTFSSTTVSGLTINKLTTAQRQALTPTSGDVVYDTTIGTTCTYNGTFWEYTLFKKVTSTFSTTSTTMVSITGLSFPVETNSTYLVEGVYQVGTSNTSGYTIGHDLLSGVVSNTYMNGIATSLTTFQQVASANGAGGATFMARVISTTAVRFSGFLSTTSTAGNINMQVASALGTNTISVLANTSANSYATFKKVA